MKRLTDEIIRFFQNQGFVIVSTMDGNGRIHNSCKGVVKLESKGLVYLLDLYRQRTYANLKRNPHISITAVDEHKFIGYCLKGKAKIIPEEKIMPSLIKAWEERITNRLTSRVLRNIRGEKGHLRHPEALLPKQEYMIVMKAEEIIDLVPHQIKQERRGYG